MNNNILLFRSYVVCSYFFLIPLALFVTNQFLQFFKLYYISCFLFLSYFSMVKKKLNTLNFMKLFDFYVISKQWFLAICLLEFFNSYHKVSEDWFFISLAFCYRKLSYYNIAEYYYLKAIDISCEDIVLLAALANMYDQIDEYNKAFNIYRQIYHLDKSYLIPERYDVF